MRHHGPHHGTPVRLRHWVKSSGHHSIAVEVLALDGASYRVLEVYTGEQRVRAMPFDAIELELGALWAR